VLYENQGFARNHPAWSESVEGYCQFGTPCQAEVLIDLGVDSEHERLLARVILVLMLVVEAVYYRVGFLGRIR